MPRDGDQMMLWCDATLLILIQLSNQLLAHDCNQQSARPSVTLTSPHHPAMEIRMETEECNCGLTSANTVFCDGRIVRRSTTRSVSAAITPEKSIRAVQLSRVTCLVSASPGNRIKCDYEMKLCKRSRRSNSSLSSL